MEFSIRELMTDALKPLLAEAAEKGLGLSFEISPTVPDLLDGDPDRLKSRWPAWPAMPSGLPKADDSAGD
jgi:hypothetical protein